MNDGNDEVKIMFELRTQNLSSYVRGKDFINLLPIGPSLTSRRTGLCVGLDRGWFLSPGL